MQIPGTESAEKQPSTWMDAVMGIAMIPVLFMGACLAIPYTLGVRWLRIHGEHKLRLLMKSRGRLITWPEFVRAMHETGGTCIEEKFTAKGPVRFWWTQEDVHRESPHEITSWFTMRKGRQYEPFVHWCRARYTSADEGSAVLVDTPLVPRREIYALWSECRSDAMKAQWIEVAPPEILPHKPGQ
ncbi:MAG: hypothetical protein ABSA85_14120 [Terracidiphilus sp.]